MSKNFKGYMGDQIGKLGPAVGRRWKNRMVYSSYQGKVKNPRTTEQMAVRGRFKTLVDLGKDFVKAYGLGLAGAAKTAGITVNNMFVKKNWNAVSGDSAELINIDYSSMVLSSGSLEGVTFSNARFDDTLSVKVNYAANLTGYKADADDEVYVFAYAPEVEEGVVGVAVRNDGTVTLTVPSGWVGLSVHVWGFTIGATKGYNLGLASDSTYIGNGTIS